MDAAPAPPADCKLCPRLAALRADGDVPACGTGAIGAPFLAVTLLPGDLAGIGDVVGRVLGDGLLRITHALRYAVPARAPAPAEMIRCNRHLRAELQAMRGLRAVLAFGAVAHSSALAACGLESAHMRYRPGAVHALPDGLLLADLRDSVVFCGEEAEAALRALVLRLTAAGEPAID
jgi:uracil-DNA glycosylase